jgi:hypothetical protein
MEQGLGSTPESSTLVMTSMPANNSPNRSNRNRPMCRNCKQVGHATEYCVCCGGKMAGKTIEHACKAQRAAQGKVMNGNTKMTVTTSTHIVATPTNHQAMSTTLVPTAPSHGTPLVINGKMYFPEPDHADTALVTNHSVHLSPGDLFEYNVFMAVHDDM